MWGNSWRGWYVSFTGEVTWDQKTVLGASQASGQMDSWEQRMYWRNSQCKGPKGRWGSVTKGCWKVRGSHREQGETRTRRGRVRTKQRPCKDRRLLQCLWLFYSKWTGTLQGASTGWNDQSQLWRELLYCEWGCTVTSASLVLGSREQESVTSWGPWQQSKEEVFVTWSSEKRLPE